MKEAIDCGVDVLGYCPWSTLNLISTHQSFEKRCGFIFVNRNNTDLKDLSRLKKKSFFWYKKVITASGEDLD
jgi:6-phospho-beta-glucosidase